MPSCIAADQFTVIRARVACANVQYARAWNKIYKIFAEMRPGKCPPIGGIHMAGRLIPTGVDIVGVGS
jgi:hypothetical protein